VGEFARVALRTANIDYNGRLYMSRVIFVAGSDVAECSPITTGAPARPAASGS